MHTSTRRLAALVGATLVVAAGLVAAGAPAHAATGLSPGNGTTVDVYATSVNVRHGGSSCDATPSVSNCGTVGATINSGNQRALCQQGGETITSGGNTSKYWTWIALGPGNGSGFVSNVYISGAAHLAGVADCSGGEPSTVTLYGSSVNVRHGAAACDNSPSTTSCTDITGTTGPGRMTALCQQSGQTISAGGYTSSYWTWVLLPGQAGFVSNVYAEGAAHLAGIPDCIKQPVVTAPGAPAGVTATAGNAQAMVSWKAPSSTGGAAISKYTVTSSPGGKTATATGTSAAVTGLNNGTSYTFTVTATNSAGVGSASAKSNSVTPTGPVTKPGAPTGVTATAGDAQAMVSWKAPSSTGGAAISKYTVTSSPGGKTATTAGTSASVAGLTNGTSYTFTVTATNSAGTGAASAASNAVTPKQPSGPPPVTSKPTTTNSHYVRNQSGDSSDYATATKEGAYDANQASPEPSLILLSYGDQTISPDGVTAAGGDGDFYVDDAHVAAHAKAYLDGWESMNKTSDLQLVIGTNNDLGAIAQDAGAAGATWADDVIDPVVSYAKKYPNVTVSGGMDIEDWAGSGDPGQTKTWITSFLANTTADFVNHGAISGCPTTYTTGQSAACEDGWSQADYAAVSGGLDPSRISDLPQVYYGCNANQWEAVDLIGVTTNNPKLNFAGTLTENRADAENGDSADRVDGPNLAQPQADTCPGPISPTDSWNDLRQQLQSSSMTQQTSLPYSTDLFDDSATTTPPPA